MIGSDFLAYWQTSVPFAIDSLRQFRMLRAIFVLTFCSTVAVHWLLPEEATLLAYFAHATTIALTYTFSVAALGVLLYLFRRTREALKVWQIWLLSFAGFTLGHQIVPLDTWIHTLTGYRTNDHAGTFSLLELMPVWIVITYLFVEPYRASALRSEVDSLRARLEQMQTPQVTDAVHIHLTSGRKTLELDASLIRNIEVQDHYCYLYVEEGDNMRKDDIGLPLKDISALLPAGFVQVHRSHLVNLQFVEDVQITGRRLRLRLRGGIEVPISRHRLNKVLPHLNAIGLRSDICITNG